MKSKKYVIFSVLIILLTLIKGYLFSTKYVADDWQKEYTVFIESLKSKSDTKVAYNVKLLNTGDKFILNIYDKSYDNQTTDLNQYANYIYGDVIKVKAKISIPKKLNNPGEFNYKLYLYSNNIYGLINTYEIPEKINYDKNVIENIYSKIYMFKSYVQNIIKNNMSETNANVAMTMIYGDTTQLDESIQQNFEDIGVSHLMSVSGTHISSFMLIINFILSSNERTKRAKNNKKKNSKINKNKICKVMIKIICIFMYVVFTGFGISVLRAALMIVISLLCDLFDIKKNRYLALLITLLIILINTPYVIFNTGMRLSFLATLGIVAFSKNLTGLFSKLLGKVKNEYVKGVITFVIQNIAITISVQLMIIPIQIQAFNKLPLPVILPNLILGILSTPIIIIGTIGIMLSFIPKIAILLFKLTEIFVTILLNASKVFKIISFSISTVSMPLMFFVLYYIFVLGIFIYFKLNNIVKIDKITKNTKYNLKKLLKYLKVFEIVMAVSLVTLVIFLNIYSIHFSQYVYFFNVEQGDMSYIKCGKASIIVDIGSLRNNLAFNTISNYLKTANLTKVDLVIISHMHKDHINGLEQLLQNYQVGMVIYSKPKENSVAYQDFKEMLTKYNVASKEAKAGDEITIGKMKVQVLFPGNEYIASDEVNANSLVCKITVNDKHLLYMGDASKETEERIIEEYTKMDNIYILKVGHHGSKTATSDEFVQQIKPQNAVISALKKYYGHPHQNTIDTLKENGVYTYLTEKQGAVKFSLN